MEVTEDQIVRPKACPPSSTSHRQTIQEVAKSEIEKLDLDAILDSGFTCLILAHYRNQLLYLFVLEAMAALSLRGNTPCDRGRQWIVFGRQSELHPPFPSPCRPMHTGTALRRFTALHCALASEFVLPLRSPTEVCSSVIVVQ